MEVREVLVTESAQQKYNERANAQPVLVTGATGRVGRAVIAELLGSGVPVRALTRTPATTALPATAEVVAGDLIQPDSLGPALQGVRAVFLLWTAPLATAAAVVERLASHTRRVVFLSSPHQTPHPFFRQPNPMARLHAEIERLIVAAGLESTFIRPGIFASNAQFWWGPAIRVDGVGDLHPGQHRSSRRCPGGAVANRFLTPC